MTPLLEAYPKLEHFQVRGGNGLELGAFRHDTLRALVIESGGLDAEVVRQVCAAQAPALEHLELWLGDPNYGATTTVADLGPLLSGALFPRLTSLALRDSELADPIAAALAASPPLRRLQTLDLSR